MLHGLTPLANPRLQLSSEYEVQQSPRLQKAEPHQLCTLHRVMPRPCCTLCESSAYQAESHVKACLHNGLKQGV